MTTTTGRPLTDDEREAAQWDDVGLLQLAERWVLAGGERAALAPAVVAIVTIRRTRRGEVVPLAVPLRLL